MKKQTIANLTSVLAVLKNGPKSESGELFPMTPAEVVASTGLSIHQVNALEGTWSHGKGENGEQLPSAVASPLWERTQKAGHTFLVLTEAGAAWEAPKASPKAAKAKAPVMDLEEARRALAGAPVVSQVGKEVEAEA